MPIKIYASELVNSSPTEHRYGLINRPPSIGSVPKGYNAYDPDNQGIDGVRHGVLTYDQALSDAQVKQYELLPLSSKSGKPLQVPRFPQAIIRKVQEAIDSLNYVREEKMDEEEENVREVMDEAHKTLKIFRDYAQRKRLDADAALEELGYKH